MEEHLELRETLHNLALLGLVSSNPCYMAASWSPLPALALKSNPPVMYLNVSPVDGVYAAVDADGRSAACVLRDKAMDTAAKYSLFTPRTTTNEDMMITGPKTASPSSSGRASIWRGVLFGESTWDMFTAAINTTTSTELTNSAVGETLKYFSSASSDCRLVSLDEVRVQYGGASSPADGGVAWFVLCSVFCNVCVMSRYAMCHVPCRGVLCMPE